MTHKSGYELEYSDFCRIEIDRFETLHNGEEQYIYVSINRHLGKR